MLHLLGFQLVAYLRVSPKASNIGGLLFASLDSRVLSPSVAGLGASTDRIKSQIPPSLFPDNSPLAKFSDRGCETAGRDRVFRRPTPTVVNCCVRLFRSGDGSCGSDGRQSIVVSDRLVQGWSGGESELSTRTFSDLRAQREKEERSGLQGFFRPEETQDLPLIALKKRKREKSTHALPSNVSDAQPLAERSSPTDLAILPGSTSTSRDQ